MRFGPHSSPDEILAWALGMYPRLLMTSAFNLNGVVLIDLAAKAGYRGKVVFVDTGGHFTETLQTRDRVAERYPDLEVVTLRSRQAPDRLPPCGSAHCCELRKLAPLRQYLEAQTPDALLSARSRYQGDTRRELEAIEPGDTPKINPLAYQPRAAIEAYARRHGLPVNPLYWRGYLSVGCASVTRAVKAGEDVRAGRWAGEEKTECGLWLGDRAL